jgi:hypothetical protein
LESGELVLDAQFLLLDLTALEAFAFLPGHCVKGRITCAVLAFQPGDVPPVLYIGIGHADSSQRFEVNAFF